MWPSFPQMEHCTLMSTWGETILLFITKNSKKMDMVWQTLPVDAACDHPLPEGSSFFQQKI